MSGDADRRLGPVARRLAGVAARLLGWRPGEFWDATPAELAAVLLPEGGSNGVPLGRDELNKLMERENGGHGRRH